MIAQTINQRDERALPKNGFYDGRDTPFFPEISPMETLELHSECLA